MLRSPAASGSSPRQKSRPTLFSRTLRHILKSELALICIGFGWFNAGCSLLFVTPPPASRPPQGQFESRENADECTTSRVAPVLDAIATGLQVVRTVAAVAADDSVYRDPDMPLSREADILAGTVFVMLHTSSMVYGFTQTNACRELKRGYTVDEYTPPPEWLLGNEERSSAGSSAAESVNTTAGPGQNTAAQFSPMPPAPDTTTRPAPSSAISETVRAPESPDLP